MPHLFPTLDALAPTPPKSDARTEWVSGLAAISVPNGPTGGWTPPPYGTGRKMGDDAEQAKRDAQEEGFCAGYLQGQKAGRERGLAEGRREGRDEGREEVLAMHRAATEEFRQALSSVVDEVGPAVEAWQTTVEARAASLAMDAVRALLAAELATQRPQALGIVKEALGHADGAIRAIVRISPFDRATVAEHKEALLAACAGLRDLEIVDDHSISGGCIVETEQGLVDATLETRLGLMEAA